MYGFDVPMGSTWIRRAPEGKALDYLLTRGRASNIWRQALAGGPPKQITNFHRDPILSLARANGVAVAETTVSVAIEGGCRRAALLEMETLLPLASALGLGMLAGARLYLTVLAVGALLRFHWLPLPAAWQHASVLADTRILIAAGDVLGLKRGFDENDLYANLTWLSARQPRIEDRLFARRHGPQKPNLFLYDVTSSYLEGERNAYGAYGYPRDGKKGKQQIVLGLLCDEQGAPLSTEVFRGNTQDPKTFAAQVQTLCSMEMKLDGGGSCLRIPQPRAACRALLKAADLHLPEA